MGWIDWTLSIVTVVVGIILTIVVMMQSSKDSQSVITGSNTFYGSNKSKNIVNILSKFGDELYYRIKQQKGLTELDKKQIIGWKDLLYNEIEIQSEIECKIVFILFKSSWVNCLILFLLFMFFTLLV